MHTDICLRNGKIEDAPQIARMIVMAMTDECCRHFYGENHSADEFLQLITRLVSVRDTQYSYENTICATDGNAPDSWIVGISVSYDGGRLVELRKAFLDAALSAFGIDHSGMSNETETGELYLDSLAVLPEYRGRGIAKMLLKATAEKARRSGCGPLGLLVDEGNPRAERLYTAVGFKHVGNNSWGGHAMKHLQLSI